MHFCGVEIESVLLRCQNPIRRKVAPLLKLCNDVTGGQRIHKTVTSRCRRFDCACVLCVLTIFVIRWLSHPITDLSCSKANEFSLIPLRSAWLASAINNVALESSSNCIECMRTGRSAGGLLIGNVVNWRPDLFQVCLATLHDAGFDCFRKHLLNSLTLIHLLSYPLICSLTRSTYLPCAVPIEPPQAVVAGVPFVDLMNTMCDPTIPLTTGEWEEWGNPNEVSWSSRIE